MPAQHFVRATQTNWLAQTPGMHVPSRPLPPSAGSRLAYLAPPRIAEPHPT